MSGVVKETKKDRKPEKCKKQPEQEGRALRTAHRTQQPRHRKVLGAWIYLHTGPAAWAYMAGCVGWAYFNRAGPLGVAKPSILPGVGVAVAARGSCSYRGW